MLEAVGRVKVRSEEASGYVMLGSKVVQTEWLGTAEHSLCGINEAYLLTSPYPSNTMQVSIDKTKFVRCKIALHINSIKRSIHNKEQPG